jgi:hypothetical protein
VREEPILVAISYLLGAILLVALADAEATPRIQFEKYTLPNGLEVILHGLRSTKVGPVEIRTMSGQPLQ